MRNIASAGRLLREALRVLCREPRILVLAALELLVLSVVFAVAAKVVYEHAADDLEYARELLSPKGFALHAAGVVMVGTYISGIFAVMVTEVVLRLHRGEDFTYRQLLRRAWEKKWTVLTLTLIDTLVGWVLRIGERSRRFERYSKRLAGMAWSALRVLTIPAAVAEDVSGTRAIRRSGELLRRRWGTAVLGRMLVPGAAILITASLTVPVLVLLTWMDDRPWFAGGGALVLVVLGMMLRSVLSGIFSAELYLEAVGKRKALTGRSRERTRKERSGYLWNLVRPWR